MVDSGTQQAIANGVAEGPAHASAARSSYWFMIPCYLYILYYGISGYKVGLKKAGKAIAA
jgi:hypothetical protein